MDEGKSATGALPRLNPCFFFQRKEFEGERGKAEIEPDLPANIEIFGASPLIKSTLLETFSMVTFHRHGILRGEYVLHPNGTILFDRRGDMIIINSHPENYLMAHHLIDLVNNIREDREAALELWDDIRLVERPVVASSTFSRNYYHFTLDLIAGFRFLEFYDFETIVMPTHCMAKRFQGDLIARVIGSRRVVPITLPKRVRDPVLVQSTSSRETLLWLRKTTGIAAKPGTKRYYLVRRPEARVPLGNNLSESAEFLRLLDEYGFVRVDFGQGEHSIAEQVAMLEDAQIVLSVSGANVTNIAYLSPPLSVIEVFAKNRVSSAHMHTSARLGFAHFGIVSDGFDLQGNAIVDPALLRTILERIVAQS
jgi:hypothetical protein